MYQAPMQQPPKKKPNPLMIVLIVLGSACILCAACGIIFSALASHGSSASTTASSSNTTNGGPTSAPTATPTPTAAPTWQQTQTFNGNGINKTATFTVGNDWKINWTCDPTSFDNIQYNVIVGVDNADNTPLDPAAINTLCKDGNASGSTEEHQGGTVYLSINSEAAWSITIQELK